MASRRLTPTGGADDAGRAPAEQMAAPAYHYGVNAGFRSVLTFVADGSFGLSLMTDDEGGRTLDPAFCGGVFASNGQGSFPPID
jgi:hypothetical protein